MDIADAKKRRSELWAQLDAIQQKKEPLMKKERAIRANIKDLQHKLYNAEMKR